MPLDIFVQNLQPHILVCQAAWRVFFSQDIFIPKKDVPYSPGEVIPTTINNCFTASSVKSYQSVDRGFENTTVLYLILSGRKYKMWSAFVTPVDIQKDFDSIAHDLLNRVLKTFNIYSHIINFIDHLYKYISTRLYFSDCSSDPVLPSRGVKQECLLSPLLFNMGIDLPIRALPNHIWILVG